MSRLITSITAEQKAQIPNYIKKWVDMASGETDIAEADRAVEDIYADMGLKKPTILHFDSPNACYQALPALEQSRGKEMTPRLYAHLSVHLSRLRSQLNSQMDRQLESYLHSRLSQHLNSLMDSQLSEQLLSQLNSYIRRPMDFLFKSPLRISLIVFWRLVWVGYYDYARYIGVQFDEHKLDLMIRFISNIGFCSPFTNVFIYSLKPTEIHWANGRLHNPDGQAVRYADGWGWYALNGIPMEEWQVTTPTGDLSLGKILLVEDIDQRRELVRRVGVELLASEGKELDRAGDYKLLDMRAVYKRNTPTLFLLMKNPSVPDTWHCEGVGNECKTVRDALNWRKPDAMKRIPVSENGEGWYQQGDVCIWPANALMLKEFPCVLT